MTGKRVRCAIYTRKSSEEGLDQAFNSLHAQRDACAAYIRSQAGQGWTALRTAYDDGGVSGGTMDRGALQQLLADVDAGRIDVVVVYKVDRLTRSLSDFARIVETFDAQGVSFVSVTQQFNTTSSMGRLTLNVLLSFAQFEREVTAERIRDKIAASKKKGMWMGGVVPLGYDVIDRKLIINEAEADTVRQLFDLYLQHGNVQAVCDEAFRRGLRTKPRTRRYNGRRGGDPFLRGHVYRLLSNPLYIGEITHKGERYPGEHQGIIDQAVWDAVQAQLANNAVGSGTRSGDTPSGVLTGVLFDEEGTRLTPTHTSKGGRRYRYYASEPGASSHRWRLPAPSLEAAVCNAIVSLLNDRQRLMNDVIPARCKTGTLETTFSLAAGLGRDLQQAGPATKRGMIREFVERVVLTSAKLRITLRKDRLRSAIGLQAGDASTYHTDDSDLLMLEQPFTLRRRGVETRFIIPGEKGSAKPDDKLIAAVTQAHRWFAEFRDGRAGSVRDLARQHQVDQGDVSRILPLAFLAPDIIEAILAGRQPVELTVSGLKRGPELPASWVQQRQMHGFG